MRTFIWITLSLMLLAGNAFCWDYRVGCGDILNVSVWDEPSLSVETIVRPDGKITLPAAGDFAADGKTPEQLAGEIQESLTVFVKKPIVTVAVKQITNNKVYISGGGIPPRVLNLPGQTSLFKLLCSLEGVENVDLHRSYLLRQGEQIAIDFFDLFSGSDLSKDLLLLPEDVLVLPSNVMNRVFVLGSVREPKTIPYLKGMRVLDALFAAGGMDEFAKKSHIILFRGESERIELRTKELLGGKDVSQNIELAAGDYLFVMESIF